MASIVILKHNRHKPDSIEYMEQQKRSSNLRDSSIMPGDTRDTQPPARARTVNYADPVLVFVGAQPENFPVPEDKLCSRSMFFASELSKLREAGIEKGILLSTVQPDAFNSYAHWLYSDEISVSGMPDNPGLAHKELSELWVLGKTLEDVCFRNEVLSAIVQLRVSSKTLPGVGAVNYTWANTSDLSPIRKLYLAMHAFLQPDFMYDKANCFNNNFIRELCASLLENVDEGELPNRTIDLSLYHETM